MKRAEQLADMIEAARNGRPEGHGTRIEIKAGDWQLMLDGLRAYSLINRPELAATADRTHDLSFLAEAVAVHEKKVTCRRWQPAPEAPNSPA